MVSMNAVLLRLKVLSTHKQHRICLRSLERSLNITLVIDNC